MPGIDVDEKEIESKEPPKTFVGHLFASFKGWIVSIATGTILWLVVLAITGNYLVALAVGGIVGMFTNSYNKWKAQNANKGNSGRKDT
jgi:hypothetical protein